MTLVGGASALAAEAGGRKTVRNGWDASWFDYGRPETLVVEETTPTPGQVDYTMRPAQVRVSAADLQATTERAKPRHAGDMKIVHLRYVDPDRDVVPALLATPKGKKGPFPVVVALHGLTSHKAQIVAQVGPAMAGKGIAVLALDLPRHGERPGDSRSVVQMQDPAQSLRLFRQAVVNVRQLIDLAETRPELDTKNGVILAGYSMGSWVSSVVGPADPRVRAMVLMVGGAHELPPAALLIPQVAATDPRLAVAHFGGKPLLMLCGRHDHVVTPQMSKRLFAAARQPKELIWYDCGHLLTPEAYQKVAEWVQEKAGTPATR